MEFSVGDRVKFKADYLRSTGQLLGGDCHKVWTVLSCRCKSFVAVNERSVMEYTEDEMATDPCLKWRHIRPSNLQRVGQLVADRVPQNGFLKTPGGI